MAFIKNLKCRIQRVHAGIDTCGETFLLYAGVTLKKAFNINAGSKFYFNARIKRLRREFWHEEDNTYHIKDIRFPALNAHDESLLLRSVFEDSFGSYLYFGDKYDEATVNLCDKIFGEGIYGLVNDKVNVTVQPGDIVIDAGAWIGDFAAYASVKGATCYAFEPTETTFAILQKTAELNGNIIPVKKGLSDSTEKKTLFVNMQGNSGGNSLMKKSNEKQEESSSVETITLDDFVRENNLLRVDFIKSDIEGFERNMLEGAQETLARFAPKLALCTYHLPDDPQVMEALIKKANPKYNVVQKSKKLYASVPE